MKDGRDELMVGILALQGDVREHELALQQAARKKYLALQVIKVKKSEQLNRVSGLIIPGGESTTISFLLAKKGLHANILDKFEKQELVLFGTCAGLILLSKEVQHDEESSIVEGLLSLLPIKTVRNAYGRQKDSFIAPVELLDGKRIRGAFIRAPKIKSLTDDTTRDSLSIIGRLGPEIVAVKMNRILGATFHPEITEEPLLHEMFLDMILDNRN